MTLQALSTRTTVQFMDGLDNDVLVLDGQVASEADTRRTIALLNRVRRLSETTRFARVESDNNFPTASGLASSASGFAALACAALAAAGVESSQHKVSHLARESSVSAARSAFGGFVSLDAKALIAEPLNNVPADLNWAMVIAVTTRDRKDVGSSAGMIQTQQTSPFYSEWCSSAVRVFDEVRKGLANGDLRQLGEAMEHSTLLMHATMMASRPGLVYLKPATLSVVNGVQQLRESGTPAYFTIDAGAHVKVLTPMDCAPVVRDTLLSIGEVEEVLVSGVGPGAHLVSSE